MTVINSRGEPATKRPGRREHVPASGKPCQSCALCGYWGPNSHRNQVAPNSKLQTRNHLRRRWPEVSGDVRKNEILVSHGLHARAHRGCVEPLLKTRRLTLPTWDPRECQKMSQNVTEIENVPMRGRPVRGICRRATKGGPPARAAELTVSAWKNRNSSSLPGSLGSHPGRSEGSRRCYGNSSLRLA